MCGDILTLLGQCVGVILTLLLRAVFVYMAIVCLFTCTVGNRGGSVGSAFDSGPMFCRFECHLRN